MQNKCTIAGLAYNHFASFSNMMLNERLTRISTGGGKERLGSPVPQLFGCAGAGLSAHTSLRRRTTSGKQNKGLGCGKGGGFATLCPPFAPSVLKPKDDRKAPLVPSGRENGGAARCPGSYPSVQKAGERQLTAPPSPTSGAASATRLRTPPGAGQVGGIPAGAEKGRPSRNGAHPPLPSSRSFPIKSS